MFYRATNAVLAQDLITAFNLDANKLGLLSSVFFYAFAVSQIPMGMLLDRIGARKVVTAFALTGAAGAFVFALAEGFYTALIGRVLLGIGMASALMGALKVFIGSYPQERFSTLSGIIISIGTLGSVFATSPLVYLNSIMGWRSTMIYAGIVNALFAIFIFILLKPQSGRKPADISARIPRSNDVHPLHTLRNIIAVLSFWQIGSMAFFRYGTFSALQGVWLGPYFMNIKHFSPMQTGNILMMMSIGMAIGSPIAGHFADKIIGKTKPVLMFGIVCYTICLFLLSLRGGGIAWYSGICLLLGFFNGFGMLAYSHVQQIFPFSMSGTATAGVNFFIMSGGAFCMQIIGYIISRFSDFHQAYSASAFNLAFFICFAGMAAGSLFYAFSRQGGKGR